MAARPQDWPPGAPGDTPIEESELETRLLLRRLSEEAGDWPLRSDPADPVNQMRLRAYRAAGGR